MAQTTGTIPALTDGIAKQIADLPPKRRKPEPVPGMMATRQALKGHRAASMRHIPKRDR